MRHRRLSGGEKSNCENWEQRPGCGGWTPDPAKNAAGCSGQPDRAGGVEVAVTPGPALHEAESPGRVCWGLGGHTVTDKGAAASAVYEPGAETRARSGEAGASGWARRLWDDPGWGDRPGAGA